MPSLPAYTLFHSNDKNPYVLDHEKGQMLICHPVLKFLLKLHGEGGSADTWVKQIGDDPLMIDGSGPWTAQDIHYYHRKFKLLRYNGYFSHMDLSSMFTPRMTPDHVEQALANNRRITFEVTDRCNLNCKYCGYGKFYSGYDARENKNLDTRIARSLLEYMCAQWNSPVNVNEAGDIYVSFYGGEPLLNDSFIKEIVSFCKKLPLKRNRIKFLMTTNGVLLNKHIDFLVAENFLLIISLDGHSDHNSYRVFHNQKGSHSTILRNLNGLRQNHPEFFRNRVFFNTVLHNRNSVESVVDYFKNEFDKIPRISDLNTMGVRKDRLEEFLDTYKNFSESFSQAGNCNDLESELFSQSPNARTLDRMIHENCDFCFTDYSDMAFEYQEKKRFPTATCLPFSKKVFLTVNGKILPCERIGFQHGLGKATPESIELDFTRIAEKYNDYYDRFGAYCRRCYNYKTCGQCLFLSDLESEKIICDDFRNRKQHARHLERSLSYLEEKPETFLRLMKHTMEVQDA